MKYLRKFNEGLTQKELKEVRYDLEDVLIDIDDLNIKRKDDFLYKIDTYSNSSSMRDISISETFRIDVRFWKNGDFFSFEDFESLKPIFDRLIRTMEPISSEVKLVISHWDVDENNQYIEMKYDKMIDYLSSKVGVFDMKDDSGEFLPRPFLQSIYLKKLEYSKITGFKLKFELK